MNEAVQPAHLQWSCGLRTEPKTLCSSPSSWMKDDSLVGLAGRFGVVRSPTAPTLLVEVEVDEFARAGEAVLLERVV